MDASGQVGVVTAVERDEAEWPAERIRGDTVGKAWRRCWRRHRRRIKHDILRSLSTEAAPGMPELSMCVHMRGVNTLHGVLSCVHAASRDSSSRREAIQAMMSCT